MKNQLIPICLLAIVAACNTNQNQEKVSVNTAKEPTFKIEKVTQEEPERKQQYAFNSNQGSVIKSDKGSIIMIPKDAFVYEDGTPVTGEVQLQFEEFYTPTDIVASGIPMNVMVENKPIPFESNGMFNIQASANNKKIKLKENTELAVATPSTKKQTDFKYWFFDEKIGEWKAECNKDKSYNEKEVMSIAAATNPEQTRAFAANNKTVSNPTELALNSKTKDVQKPSPPAEIKPNDFTFEIQVNNNNLSELDIYKNVIWKTEDALSVNEQTAFTNAIANNNVKVNCIDENDQLYEINYGGKNKKIRPIFLGADKAKAKAKYAEKLKEYNKALLEAKSQQVEENLTATNYQATYNLFAVKQMGIYNCDRYYNFNRNTPYTFKKGGKKLQNQIFAILKGGAGVVVLSAAYKIKNYFRLDRGEIAGFIHTDKEGKLHVAANENGLDDDAINIEFTLFSETCTSKTLDQAIASFN